MPQDSSDNGHGIVARRARARSRAATQAVGSDRPRLTLADPATDRPVRRRPGQRRRRGVSSLAWLIAIPAAICSVVLVVVATRSGPPPRLVVASLPYWNIGPGTESVLANRNDVDEVSPWMYGLGSNGQIISDSGVDQTTMEANLDRLRSAGLAIVPTLANINAQGNWTYPVVARVLHTPALAKRQVAQIVSLAETNHYAGIDLDYENLQARDRQAFTAFVTSLAAALHAKGKILSVALFAKTTNAGYAPRNVAQDYAAVGKVADQVRLMAYDYHWPTSPPGPIAPIGWVRDVIKYAKTQIPASKIILGIPEYGYDWSGGHAIAIGWLQALRLSRQYHVQSHYSASSQSPWFSYTVKGHKHVVWFENAESSQAKLDVAKGSGIGGVYLWMYGYVDPGSWSVLHKLLPVPSHSADPAQRGSS
jgi:spore germination protein